MVKNLNSKHRIEGVQSQFGLMGALNAGKAKVKAVAGKAQ
jgi:hypothetical protein